MKTPKLLLLFVLFTVLLSGCTKQSLEEDELLLNKADVIYASGGQTVETPE